MLLRSTRFRLATIVMVVLCGIVLSAPVLFARSVNVVSRAAIPGNGFPLHIKLVSDGNEQALSFTLSWNPVKISYVSSALGSGVPGGCFLTVNPANAATGQLGVLIDCPTSFTAGTRDMLVVNFLAAVGVTGTTQVGFMCPGGVTACATSDGQANALTTPYVPGNVTFNPTAANVSLSGQVMIAGGQPLRSAEVYIQDAAGNRQVAITSTFGYYQFDNVEAGQTYIIGVSSKRYHFDTKSVVITDNLTDVDFVAQAN